MNRYCKKFHKWTNECPSPETSLSKEQIEELRSAFDMFDEGKRDYIHKPDLRKMLKIIGYNLEDKAVDILINIVDHDKNNKIDFGEFLHLVVLLEKDDKREEDVRSAFHSFDTMGNGFISSQDIEDALLVLLKKESQETRKDVIKHFRLDTHRAVSFEEFTEMINSKW